MHPHNPYRPPSVPNPPPPPPPGIYPMQPGWSPTLQPSPEYTEQMRRAMQPVPSLQAQPYVIPPRPFNHGIHFIVDVCSFGMWVPFHLLIWACHPRKSTIVYPDGRREKR